MINENFDIKYMIGRKEKKKLRKIKNIEQFEKREVTPDGWISIQLGNYEYVFLTLDDSLPGFELLDVWFDAFKNVYIELQNNTTAEFEYWEGSEFFVFEKKDAAVHIAFYERKYPIINGRFAMNEKPTIELCADTTVSADIFFHVLKTRINEFWSEVGNLNAILKTYVEKCKIIQ